MTQPTDETNAVKAASGNGGIDSFLGKAVEIAIVTGDHKCAAGALAILH